MNTTQFALPSNGIPTSQLDPYRDEALVEPWETYPVLKNLGSAVWLTKYEMFTLARYAAPIPSRVLAHDLGSMRWESAS